ncbi:hypothetical protein [Paenibacillus ihbetae]|uniref:DUF3899 domain-containing protein n=1 Tax=Paenibacillus ihbetae TaxID=1870820 RepID=A0ABX3JWU6_9BACL|nr:hypothetical protein [Paenibacillus ihbetae]OOC62152.1 hypothetical protein BBD40_09965 [Paenibacillus ihbetae]
MAKLGSAMMEVVRMMILFMLGTAIVTNIELAVLQSWVLWKDYYILFLFLGNVLGFLVLYRNRLQFGGWYRSKTTQRRLSRQITAVTITAAAVLIALPAILDLFGRLA